LYCYANAKAYREVNTSLQDKEATVERWIHVLVEIQINKTLIRWYCYQKIFFARKIKFNTQWVKNLKVTSCQYVDTSKVVISEALLSSRTQQWSYGCLVGRLGILSLTGCLKNIHCSIMCQNITCICLILYV